MNFRDPRNDPGAVIYTRVSTDEQAASGLGLEAQLARCRSLCAARGWTVEGEFSDPGVTGKTDPEDREGLTAALGCLRTRPGAVLVIYDLSRLTRRQRVLWSLLDETGKYGGLKVVSATQPFDTSTPMGRAMIGMLGVWNQLEADLISERTKVALAARRARGLRLGATPFWDSRPELLDKIGDLWSTDAYSYQQLADELNLTGIPGPRGGKWHPQSVRRAVLQCKRRGQSDSGVGGTDSGPPSTPEQGQAR